MKGKHRLHVCRICDHHECEDVSHPSPFFRYGVRHWAHADCGMKKHGMKFLQGLSTGQLERFPREACVAAGLRGAIGAELNRRRQMCSTAAETWKVPNKGEQRAETGLGNMRTLNDKIGAVIRGAHVMGEDGLRDYHKIQAVKRALLKHDALARFGAIKGVLNAYRVVVSYCSNGQTRIFRPDTKAEIFLGRNLWEKEEKVNMHLHNLGQK